MNQAHMLLRARKATHEREIRIDLSQPFPIFVVVWHSCHIMRSAEPTIPRGRDLELR
jgi:hypothetical protein